MAGQAGGDRLVDGWAAMSRRALPALLFGLRVASAVSLALFVAFYLQLETPSWAGTSAAIVCQPIVGSSLMKGVFRMVGTAVGALAAVALTAVFPQDRIGFLFGLLVWISACSFVATLLRNFAAYAAMLAGYTLVIIAATSIDAPDQVFAAAVGRASEICIGIVCGTLVIALTDLGHSPRRLSDLLTQLIGETAAHLSHVLDGAGTREVDGPAIRRELIRRTAALDAVIDQASGESPELLQRRGVLQSAMDGLFAALSAARVLETHLRSLPAAEARANARLILDRLPSDWPSAGVPGPQPPRSTLDWAGSRALVRDLLRPQARDLSERLTADGAADVALSLAAAGNGLVLVDRPGHARDLPRAKGLFVPDYLPALVNAGRTFLGVGVVVVFWIASHWTSGLKAITFTAVTIMIFSPLQETSGRAAIGQAIGTLLAAIAAGVIKFVVLPNHETFLAFSLVMAAALVPFGALSTVPALAPYLASATFNFTPLLTPTNNIDYDTLSYLNSALGLLCGCGAGAVALMLMPPVSVDARSQRLVDLSIRDLRRLASGRRGWSTGQWQRRIYARLAAMPDGAAPLHRTNLVATLSVGVQVIRLARLSRHGRLGAELSRVLETLAAGALPALRGVLDTVDAEIGAVPATTPGARGRLRARAALRAIGEAVDRRSESFEGLPA